MKTLVKKLLQLFFPLFRYYYRNRVIVLAYHDVGDAARFEKQMQFIKKFYKPIAIADVEEWLFKGKSLPRYAVLVTFDDGEPTVKSNGVPILERYGIPAVAFVISENVESRKKYWWKIIQEYRENAGETYSQARREVRRLKKVPNIERMSVLKRITTEDPAIEIDSSSLTVDDLFHMISDDVTIGSHTATHPILNECTNAELHDEFRQSRRFFEQHHITTYKYFAYPNGDYTPNLIPFLKQYGILMAFSFDHRINSANVDPFAISRLRTNADDPMWEFKLRISGISSIFLKD